MSFEGAGVHFVQFIHPGGEHRPDNNQWKAWSERSHKRKFIEQPGKCIASIDEKAPFVGDLRFWAEWEPDSSPLVKWSDGSPEESLGLPSYLYRPVLGNRVAVERPQNTDPFVFGEKFRYCICQQSLRKKNATLRNLADGSVILFGSWQDDQFVRDTVFVVASSSPYSSATYKSLSAYKDEVFREAVLEPLFNGVDGGAEADCGGAIDCGDAAGQLRRLYEGAMYAQPFKPRVFSFFPCVPAGSAERFARPKIRIEGFVNGRLRQGFKAGLPIDVEKAVSLWSEVVTQVLQAGLRLGIYAELPRRASTL